MKTRVIRTLAAALLAFAAIAAGAQDTAGAPLTPETAFSGRTDGNGSLRILFGRTRTYHVESQGTTASDGRFRLDQAVTFEGEPVRNRTWLISESTPLHYAGTLSEAAGPVSGEPSARRLVLRYRLKGPLVMHQTLVLMADGRTIDNAGRITVLGIPVGRLHETITRTGP